jgi:plasmid stabilization system protein ParE
VSFTVSPAATADLIAASAAYDRKPGRYGAALEAEVEAAYVRISENPRLYPLVEDGVHGLEIREYFIARFSQRVIYAMNGDDVLVVAVIHTDAREGAWHANLPTDPSPETT